MLEQKLKFSDKIEVQQKILNKLRLQQQQSETLAEEAVYEEPFKEQNPFNFHCIDQLPQETEKVIDQFVNQAEFLRTPPTWTGSLLSPLKHSETRTRAMTAEGVEFHSAIKENSAKAANMSFYANVTTFDAYLAD